MCADPTQPDGHHLSYGTPSNNQLLANAIEAATTCPCAMASAVKQIDSTAVTAYHLARTGKAERPVKVAAEK